MKSATDLSALLQKFFTVRLMRQRQASPHTVSSYRNTFQQFLRFASDHLRRQPSDIVFEQIDAQLVGAFPDDLESTRQVSVRTRNLRLTAIHSLFRFAAFEMPEHGMQIQQVLAIPSKRFERRQIGFLTRKETDALLAAPDRSTWFGRRDYAFILTAVQTGLRVSEMTGLRCQNLTIGAGGNLRVIGKGRKERVTPLAGSTCKVLKAWLSELQHAPSDALFPSRNGQPMTIHGVQYLLRKHQAAAAKYCPSLKDRRVTVHVLRHTAAMEMVTAGIDRTTIALWLGHESVETTQVYIEATLGMKEAALAKMNTRGGRLGRFQPDDNLMAFLKNL